MKHYTILHPVFLSFFSKPLYQDVGRRWKGYGLGYLVLLLTLLLIPEMVKFREGISDFLSVEAPKVVGQIPTITIANGELSVNKPVPYIIKYPDKDTPFIIIDTSGRIDSLKGSKAIALLTKTKIILKRDAGELRVIDLKDIGSFIINEKVVYAWIEWFRDWFAFILFPFVLLFSFLLYVTQVFLCAMIGRSFARILKVDLNYQALVRLSVIAFTPAVILQIVHTLLGIPFPYSGPASFLIALGYLYFAVSANSEEGVN